jgi:NDP-sugar pyrophosphorylase family protein
VLEPRVLKKVPPQARFDMPSLVETLIADGDRPAAFPIREYWIDIGQLEDYQRAHGEYGGVFS